MHVIMLSFCNTCMWQVITSSARQLITGLLQDAVAAWHEKQATQARLAR